MKPGDLNRVSGRRRGFALVVTLSLMILLTIIAVGLLSLSSISLRSSSAEQLNREARQNARMALMLAIGELQTATGPDQRVTAPARIQGPEVAQQHLTGVWQGWKWDGTGSPDFKSRKTSQFLRWLASSRDPTLVDRPRLHQERASRKRGHPGPGNRRPFRKGPGGCPDRGHCLRQEQPAAVASPGRFSMNPPSSRPRSPSRTGKSRDRRVWSGCPPPRCPVIRPPPSGIGAPLDLLAGQRSKLVTAGQSGLDRAGRRGPWFPRSHLAQRRASSRTWARAGLPWTCPGFSAMPRGCQHDYKDRFLYSGTATPLAPPPARFNGANPFPSPDPSWNLLHSHYRLYDKLTGGLEPHLSTPPPSQRPAPEPPARRSRTTRFSKPSSSSRSSRRRSSSSA